MDKFLYGMLIGGCFVVVLDRWADNLQRACERQHNAPCHWVLEPKE